MKKLLSSLLSIVHSLLTVSPAFAQAPAGYDLIPGTDIPTLKGLEYAFAQILKAIFALAGLATFAMLLVGGFKYLTSGGDEKAMAEAQGTLTYAIGGLVFVVLAYFVLKVLGKEILNINLLQFTIPAPSP